MREAHRKRSAEHVDDTEAPSRWLPEQDKCVSMDRFRSSNN